jgi:glycosyltransferase involved in cell wall biosynthesis
MSTNNQNLVLHISHTDVRSDSRILKELEAHRQGGNYEVHAIGVISSEGNPIGEIHPEISVESINLVSNRSKWNPRFLRHALTLVELVFRATRKAVRIRPDIVHCHDTLVLPIGLIVKLITGANLVYDAHELESDKNGQTKILSWATLMIEKASWRSVDLLVSVSPSILDWYDEKFGKKKNVLVLNSPLVIEAPFDSKVDEKRSRYFHDHYEIPYQSLVFLYIGNLSRGRGIEKILEAFLSVEIESHVVFMGYGDLSNVIGGQAAANDNVHLHLPVEHSKVVQLAKSADIGLCFVERVSLSDYYCLPNKLFEYAFSAIPVLASNFPDLKNYVERYGLGTCSDVNPASILESLKKIEENLPSMIEGDLTELTWEFQADRLVKAYDELMAS